MLNHIMFGPEGPVQRHSAVSKVARKNSLENWDVAMSTLEVSTIAPNENIIWYLRER